MGDHVILMWHHIQTSTLTYLIALTNTVFLFVRSLLILVNNRMTTNQATGTTGGGGGGSRLGGIGSPILGGGGGGTGCGAGGTPLKACKKVLPPAIPMEFLQRRNSQNMAARKEDETPTNVELMPPVQQQQQQQQMPMIESALEESALSYYAPSNNGERGKGMMMLMRGTGGRV